MFIYFRGLTKILHFNFLFCSIFTLELEIFKKFIDFLLKFKRRVLETQASLVIVFRAHKREMTIPF